MRLVRAVPGDCEAIWRMQRRSFAELLERYRDYETNPGRETRERVARKLAQEDTFFYLIYDEGDEPVGAIRVVDKKDGSRKRVAPVFILPEMRGRGLARRAFREVERLHGEGRWALDTILQEEGNCRLYESLGYVRTGRVERINERMDIVYYEKD